MQTCVIFIFIFCLGVRSPWRTTASTHLSSSCPSSDLPTHKTSRTEKEEKTKKGKKKGKKHKRLHFSAICLGSLPRQQPKTLNPLFRQM